MTKAKQTFTPDLVERFKLLCGDREFTTVCPGCFLHGLGMAPLRKGGFRVSCLSCALNGFILRADLVWPVVGCGAGLARLPYAELSKYRVRVGSAGRPLVSESNWAPAQLGKGEADVRMVLRWGVACPACGSERASLRRDVRGRGYLTCATGCRSRFFVPDDASVRRLAGWTVVRHAHGERDLWLDWHREGRDAWMGWHAPVGGEQRTEAKADEANDVRKKEA